MLDTDFAKNLRLLCDHYPSVADVCRRVDVNRSQFNKYLCGKTMPSRYMLKRICDFFGVEEYEIVQPHEQFERTIAVRPSTTPPSSSQIPHHEVTDRLLASSRDQLSRYLGFYFEYYFSMSSPQHILRTLVHLLDTETGVYSRRWERLNTPDQPSPPSRCDYRGIVCLLADRIFIVDYESLTKNEITETILYPSHKSRIDRLAGLKLGVSSSDRRQPAVGRTLWEYLGPTIDYRKALRMCGLYDAASGNIDADIVTQIDNRGLVDSSHFLARPRN